MEIPADKINTPLNITYSYSIQFEVKLSINHIHYYLFNKYIIIIQIDCLNFKNQYFSQDYKFC